MAEIKNLKIDVDTKQATQAMDGLADAAKDVANEFDKAATFAQRYGEELQPLTTRMGEAEDRLYELANAGETASKEYKDLLETVGRYRKIQIQTDLAVDSAATTMAQKLGGALGGITAGFELGQGVMGAFGAESEQVEKALLKVQSAMAIAQGVQGIKESIPMFMSLRTAAMTAFAGMTTASKIFMTAGIGVLITGVGLLMANFDKVANFFTGELDRNARYTKSLNKSARAIKDNAKELDERADALKRNQDFEYGMAEAQGATTAELRKMKVAQADERIELEKDSVARAENIYWLAKHRYQKLVNADADEDIIKKAKENAKEAREILTKEKDDLKQARLDKKDIQNQIKIDEVKDKNERIKANQESAKQASEDRKAQAELIAKSDDEAKRIAIQKENEFQQKLEDIAEQNHLNNLTDQEKELRAVQDKYFELETLANGNADALRDIEIAKLNEINNINLKYQQEAYDRDRQAAEKKKELDKKAAEDEIAQAKAVEEQKKAIQMQGLEVASQGVALIKNVFEKSKGVQRAAVVAESAIGIAKMIIANKTANIAALATPQAIATSGAAAAPVIAMNNISTAIGIAGNIAATAKALQSLGGGSTPTPPSLDGGGGSAGVGMQSPNFNVVGNSGVNQLAQLQQQPVQAYVVSGEVTSAQALDRNRVKNATL